MSNATYASTADFPQDYQRLSGEVLLWVARTVTPTCIVLGCTLNSINIILWYRGVPGVAKTARLYYFVLAASETVPLLSAHLFNVFLGIGVSQLAGSQYTSGGSLILCKINNWLWPMCEQTSNWVLVALTGERLFAVFRPLQAASVLTASRTRNFLVVLVLINLAMHSVSVLIEKPNYIPPMHVCSPDMTMIPWAALRIWELNLLCYTIPIALVSAGNVCLISKLQLETSRHAALSAASKGADRVKELSATLTVVAITSIHLMIYIPANVLGYLFTFLGDLVIFEVHLTFLALTAVTHCANFFVYFLRVPAFKTKCHELLS